MLLKKLNPQDQPIWQLQVYSINGFFTRARKKDSNWSKKKLILKLPRFSLAHRVKEKYYLVS